MPRINHMRRAAALAATASLALAATAAAQNQKPLPDPFVSATGGELTIDARASRAPQSLRIGDSGTVGDGVFIDLVVDAGPSLAAGPGCGLAQSPRTGASALRCIAPAFDRVTARLGQGDDVFSGSVIVANFDFRGGDGGDRLTGGPSEDVLAGEAGDDTLVSSDGRRDVVACGPGDDKVVADLQDLLLDCEKGARAPVGEAPSVRIVSAQRQDSNVDVTLACKHEGRFCGAQLKVARSDRSRTLAARSFRLRSGRRRTIRLHIRSGTEFEDPVRVSTLERDAAGRPLTAFVTVAR
jgi:RTX calcium-binding nonapeptide repeat (4 copies)